MPIIKTAFFCIVIINSLFVIGNPLAPDIFVIPVCIKVLFADDMGRFANVSVIRINSVE